MTHRLLTALCLSLLLAAGAYAQDCPGKDAKSAECSGAGECCPEDAGECCPKTTATAVGAMIAKLEACSAKGCEESGKKLAEMAKVAGAKDVAGLKEMVKSLEECAGAGCTASGEKLTKLAAFAKPAPLSARVAKDLEGGCLKSAERIRPMMSFLGSTCCKQFVKTVAGLETAKGCGLSAARLDILEAWYAGAKPRLSSRVRLLVVSAKDGDEAAENAVADLLTACETGCCADLVGKITALEAGAGKGEAESAKTLAALEAKVPGPLATVDADCADCSDCTDCGKDAAKPCKGCPGG